MSITDQSSPAALMFDFFQLTPDLVCIAGKDGFFRNVNPAVIKKLGYTEEELFTNPVSSFIHPDDREVTKHRRTKLLQGQELINFENRYLTKRGKTIWLAWTSIYFPEKELVFAIAKDISQRKQLERDIEDKYIKYKELTSHFKRSIEEDKKYLAIELHEELAQLAAVVKMEIEWINSNEPDLSPATRDRMERTAAVTSVLIQTIQRISFSISPDMLDEIGLSATLEWHCKEFTLLNGIPCIFESSFDESKITREVRIDFYRICQESLTNVVNHAQAANVRISIRQQEDQITLMICDDGKGFDLQHYKSSPGLVSMRERSTSINGQLTIETEPGSGTCIRLIVPLSAM